MDKFIGIILEYAWVKNPTNATGYVDKKFAFYRLLLGIN